VKTKKCSYCGKEGHTAFLCYQRQKSRHYLKRTKLRPESKATKSKRAILRNAFFANNPPDNRGGYTCYLHIHRSCPKWVSKKQVILEHVLPRAKYPELKYNVLNIMPSCAFCNATKLSNTPYQLALLYPHIASLIETQKWKEWERAIEPYLVYGKINR